MTRLLAILLCLAAIPAVAQRRAPKERPLERLQKMTPQQRAHALEKLPPERRQNLERRLERLDRLTPEEKARFQRFRELPPERQEAVRRAFNGLGSLPPERQQAVRGELKRMRALSPAARKARLASPEFHDRFRPREQRIVEELNDLPD